MKLWLVIFALCCASLPQVQAQSVSTDNDMWKALSKAEKLSFIAGYIRGRADGFSDGFGSGLSAVSTSIPNGKTFAPVDPYAANDSAYSQVINGIDACFSDFRNQGLEIGSCYSWAVMGINGKSNDERDAYLESERRVAAAVRAHYAH